MLQILSKASGDDYDTFWMSTPPVHAYTHEPGGADPITALDASVLTTGSLPFARIQMASSRLLGRTSALTGAVEELTVGGGLVLAGGGLVTSLTPGDLPPHASSHKSGGSDAIKLDELAAPTDVTTLDATTSAHGLLRKLAGIATQFLDSTGAWRAVSAATDLTGTLPVTSGGTGLTSIPLGVVVGAGGTLPPSVMTGPVGSVFSGTGSGLAPAFTSVPAHATRHQSGGADPIALDTLAAPTDVTTLNASSTAHGLLKKLSNVATQFLDGTGIWRALSATTDLTGTLPVANGGTGRVSVPAGLMVGSGTSPVAVITGGLNAVLLGAGSGVEPTFGNVTEGMITDGTILARVGANETVTGNWTFTGSALNMSSTAPQIIYVDTDGPTDQKVWRFIANGSTFFLQAGTDSLSAFNSALEVTRSGNTPDTWSFYSNGAVRMSLGLGGLAATSFQTLVGTGSANSGVATTVLTLTAGGPSVYIVTGSLGYGPDNPAGYQVVALVTLDNNTLRCEKIQSATNMDITISGMNIRLTQTSGIGPLPLRAVALRIG
jgi:hypothetical protein